MANTMFLEMNQTGENKLLQNKMSEKQLAMQLIGKV